jgi:hypothetical protein
LVLGKMRAKPLSPRSLADIVGQNWLASKDDVRPMTEALQEDENWTVSWMVTPDLFTDVADADR